MVFHFVSCLCKTHHKFEARKSAKQPLASVSHPLCKQRQCTNTFHHVLQSSPPPANTIQFMSK